ncbi:efflux RND transporter periplasmic adaptor subunit [Ramlibacter sp. AW1]|uniref:Efflux RND transporter periplasmic adaptor subunit n=1 Tax=Ramlibacter aurantiacus TaxID=2801330 RepID=A0A937D332_9BURK|nr:efflux RND transporter periplasmic adaptor subunit [Ramlibacter aurantiacus]MBL0420320.1 efflux RND transporter periplasmic adaptor subunit [Ramlibacter aurantiacus]
MDRPDPQLQTEQPTPGSPHLPPARRLGRRASLLGTLIALLIVAAVGWLAWHLTQRPSTPEVPPGRPGAAAGPGATGGGAPRVPPTTVGMAEVERADIPVTVEALGTVIPAATARVRPQVSGVLQQVNYREGQLVRAGELLAQIDPRPFELAVQQATGQRMRDEAQLAAARVTLQRFRTLLQQDSIARQEVDTQEALVKQLEAAVVVSKANEGTARLNLAHTRITAPIAGRVGLRVVDVGNVVGPSDSNGVAVITQTVPIDVEFAVPQDLIASLREAASAGAPVRAMDRTRTQVLGTGRLASFDNQIDAQTGTVRAKARFANSDGALFPNQFVNVRLQLRTIEGALVVPVAAVRSGPQGEQVFVVNADRTVSLRNVQRGHTTTDRVQIVQGLSPGERVVTEGADRLRDGSRVALPGDAARGSGGRGGAGEGGRRPAAPADAAVSPGAAPGGPPASSSAATATATATATAATPAASRVAGAAPRPGDAAPAGPSPDQRRRLLDSAQGDPELLARRQSFLQALDRGEPAALERWRQMQARRPGGPAGAGPQ